MRCGGAVVSLNECHLLMLLQWRTGGFFGFVRIALFDGDAEAAELTPKFAISEQQFRFTVPASLSTGIRYRIQLTYLNPDLTPELAPDYAVFSPPLAVLRAPFGLRQAPLVLPLDDGDQVLPAQTGGLEGSVLVELVTGTDGTDYAPVLLSKTMRNTGRLSFAAEDLAPLAPSVAFRLRMRFLDADTNQTSCVSWFSPRFRSVRCALSRADLMNSFAEVCASIRRSPRRLAASPGRFASKSRCAGRVRASFSPRLLLSSPSCGFGGADNIMYGPMFAYIIGAGEHSRSSPPLVHPDCVPADTNVTSADQARALAPPKLRAFRLDADLFGFGGTRKDPAGLHGCSLWLP